MRKVPLYHRLPSDSKMAARVISPRKQALGFFAALLAVAGQPAVAPGRLFYARIGGREMPALFASSLIHRQLTFSLRTFEHLRPVSQRSPVHRAESTHAHYRGV
jgi:hypothetical protein